MTSLNECVHGMLADESYIIERKGRGSERGFGEKRECRGGKREGATFFSIACLQLPQSLCVFELLLREDSRISQFKKHI